MNIVVYLIELNRSIGLADEHSTISLTKHDSQAIFKQATAQATLMQLGWLKNVLHMHYACNSFNPKARKWQQGI